MKKLILSSLLIVTCIFSLMPSGGLSPLSNLISLDKGFLETKPEKLAIFTE